MALTLLEENLNIIQGLADLPNSDDGLDPDELKAKFDEAVNIIKDYINKTLIPEVESDIDAASKGISSGSGIDGEKLVDNSVDDVKIKSLNGEKILDESLPAAKLKDKISRAQLAEDATTLKTEDFPNKVVPNRALDDNAVTNVKIEDAAVTPNKLDRPYLSLGSRTAIPANADLNDYVTCGSYACENSSNAATLSNAPVSIAFILNVYNSVGGSSDGKPTTAAYRYFLQELTSLIGEKWQRRIYYNGSTTPTVEVWKRILTTDDIGSPVKFINASNTVDGVYTLTAADAGYSIPLAYALRNTDVTVSLTAANSAAMAARTEISISAIFSEKVTIKTSGVLVGVEGQKGTGTGYLYNSDEHTFKIQNIHGTVVLKKVENNASAGDLWLLIGNVEVVS